jgi:hypothetical protein
MTGLESGDSKGHMPMRAHFIPPERPKIQHCVFRKSDNAGDVWDCEINFFLLTGPKHDLGQVEKATLQGVVSPCELIFCLLEA